MKGTAISATSWSEEENTLKV